MGQSTSYRLAFRSRADASETARVMAGIHHLPMHEARRVVFDNLSMPAMVSREKSISDLIPTEDVDDPHWSHDGQRLVFTADLVNPSYRDDDEPFSKIGDPSRQSVLLDALSAICAAEEGTVVGGWQGEYSDDWSPIVFKDGRIRLAYLDPVAFMYVRADEVEQHDGRIDPDLIKVNERGTATIPQHAFA